MSFTFKKTGFFQLKNVFLYSMPISVEMLPVDFLYDCILNLGLQFKFSLLLLVSIHYHILQLNFFDEVKTSRRKKTRLQKIDRNDLYYPQLKLLRNSLETEQNLILNRLNFVLNERNMVRFLLNVNFWHVLSRE